MDGSEAITDAAIAWHLRQADACAADWEAFVAWLEESPAHAAAYDRVAAVDRAMAGVPLAVFAQADAIAPSVVIDAAARFGRRSSPARR